MMRMRSRFDFAARLARRALVPFGLLPFALAVAVLATSCSTDAGALLVDAGAPGADARDEPPPPPDHLTGAEYDAPSDFDRIGCEPGTLSGLDPVGVWHHDTDGDFGVWNDAYGIEERQGGYSAWLGTERTRDVRLDDDDLFVRTVYQTASGHLVVRAFDACRRDDDGSLWGRYAQCSTRYVEYFGFPCLTGTFRGVRVERLPGEAEGEGISLLGEFAGSPSDPWETGIAVNVRVEDGLAYVVRHSDGLRIVDVDDPTQPRDVGRYYSGGYNDVKLVRGPGGRRYALCSSDYLGIDSIDVTDPAQPSLAATLPDLGYSWSVHTLFTVGVLVYFVDGETGGLEVWDYSDPAAPARLGGYVHPDVGAVGGSIHDLYVADGRAYLSYWNIGFVVVDVTDPAVITQVGQFDDYERRTSHSSWVTEVDGCKVAVHGDEDFGAHLRTIGVDEDCPDTFMKQIGELTLRPEVSVHNLMGQGTLAYASWYQDGIRVIDVADPAAPRLVAWFNTWQGGPGKSFFEGAIGIDVDAATGRIYVADEPRGLLILGQE